MKIWIITVGEPLPIDGKHERLYRSGILSQVLADEGHDVTWWTSSFDHTRRAQRVSKDTTVVISANLTLKMIFTPGYRKSVSLRRLMSQFLCAYHFKRIAKNSNYPDLILVSYPTIELSSAAIKMGKQMDIPVVVDIRDLWPDIFLEVFPRRFRRIGELLLWPYDYISKKIFREADGIVGITQGIKEWGVKKGGREVRRFDRDFPMGYRDSQLSAEESVEAQKAWKALGVQKENWNICFFGALGRQSKFEVVIKAAKIIEKRHPTVRFIICGSGEREQAYAEIAREVSNILFPGWVDRIQILSLMNMSRLSLTAYPSTKDFLLSIPNKPIEYMSAGLPILSNIDGALGELIRKHRIGSVYSGSDPGGLADEIEKLFLNPETLKKMSVASYSLFKRHYDAEIVYGNYSRFLQELVQTRGRSTPIRPDNVIN